MFPELPRYLITYGDSNIYVNTWETKLLRLLNEDRYWDGSKFIFSQPNLKMIIIFNCKHDLNSFYFDNLVFYKSF